MSDRRAGVTIGVSIAAATAFAIGFAIYLVHSMPTPQGPVLVAGLDGGETSGGGGDDLAAASDVAGAFIGHVGGGRFDDAYALMADAYRARHSAEQLRAAWTSSPLVAAPRAVRLSSARAVIAQVPDAGFVPSATFTARGALIVAAGALEVTFTFLRRPGAAPRVLAVAVGGVPIVEGVR